MMKSIALSLFILAIFLGPLTAKGDVSFDLSTTTKNSYTSFIRDLRNALPTRWTVCNICVPPSTESRLEWFRLFNITNYNYETITVAVNVTNVYMAAYSTGAISYFF